MPHGKYLDEDGLGLTITVSGSNYIMTNDQGMTWTFTNGILSEQKDEYGNKIWIDWKQSNAGYWFYNIYQQQISKLIYLKFYQLFLFAQSLYFLKC